MCYVQLPLYTFSTLAGFSTGFSTFSGSGDGLGEGLGDGLEDLGSDMVDCSGDVWDVSEGDDGGCSFCV